MQQVKVFVSLENEATLLEKEMNKWLAESDVRVISIIGNMSPQTKKSNDLMGNGFGASDIFVIVLYEK